MKKTALICLAVLLGLTGCDEAADSARDLTSNKAYFFYAQTCPHCHEADAYIRQNYPDLELVRLDVATPEGRDLFLKCADKFQLGRMIGTPLFCLGDHYLMGWVPAYEQRFDSYIEPFLN